MNIEILIILTKHRCYLVVSYLDITNYKQNKYLNIDFVNFDFDTSPISIRISVVSMLFSH